MGNLVKNGTMQGVIRTHSPIESSPINGQNVYHTLVWLSTKSSTCYDLLPQDVDRHCSIPFILQLESIENFISRGSRRVPRLSTAVFRINSSFRGWEHKFFPEKTPMILLHLQHHHPTL